MLSAMVLTLLAVLSALAAPPAAGDPSDLAVANAFAKEIDCSEKSKDLWRAWCAVTKLAAAKSDVAGNSKQRKLYLGVSMELPGDAPKVIPALAKATALATLSIGPEGARVTDL